MSGNLHKSEAGWVRLRARVNARQGVRAAQMDHRVSTPKPVKAKVDEDGAVVVPDHIVVKGRKRRRVTAPDGRFF